MTLQLHNTLTHKTEAFTPLHDNKVMLYTCGPTVYDSPHVGNWVANIYWDTLVRTLLADGFAVERVMNITDVGHLTSDEDEGEDKLEKGARREGKTAWDIAEFYAEDFLKGMEQLGMIMPDHMPRATDFIPQQLELIRQLKKKGYTYQIDDGIYFDTSKFPRYADFAKLDLAGQKAGARVEYNLEKRNPSDFALWKFTPAVEKRDMEWETPADILEGEQQDKKKMGFPGWHLECSAMAMNLLGKTIDIHTGGIDHIPVHHTNEIAQSEAASGQQFAKFWVHCNHLKVNGTKISKSLGNGYTLSDLEKRGFSPLDFRMFVLQGHYSNEGNFTFENLEAAKNRRMRWCAVAALRWQIPETSGTVDTQDEILVTTSDAITRALNDNLNTPEALRNIDEAFSWVEGRSLHAIRRPNLDQVLETIDNLLSLQLQSSTPDIDEQIKQLITKRQEARENKDWAKSDELRDQLKQQGIAVRDTPDGSIWEYIKTK
jgi:cysteinyl-tRNA synthetase